MEVGVWMCKVGSNGGRTGDVPSSKIGDTLVCICDVDALLQRTSADSHVFGGVRCIVGDLLFVNLSTF